MIYYVLVICNIFICFTMNLFVWLGVTGERWAWEGSANQISLFGLQANHLPMTIQEVFLFFCFKLSLNITTEFISVVLSILNTVYYNYVENQAFWHTLWSITSRDKCTKPCTNPTGATYLAKPTYIHSQISTNQFPLVQMLILDIRY